MTMTDSIGISCEPVFRYGARWCDAHDRRLARCELAAAQADPPDGCDPTFEAAGNAIWISCTCGAVGPKRAGDADSAFAMALIDRTAHLAGDDMTATPLPALPAIEPAATFTQELLDA